MELPPSDRASSHLVSRSVRIPAPPFRSVLERAERPRTVWDAPDEATVIGGGAAAALTAEGTGRFGHVREAAEGLFAAGDVHAGTEAARPRLFGGFAFHDDHGPAEPPWAGFPAAQFVLPRVQVTYPNADANEAWLTVTAAGPDAAAAAVEERLASERERVAGVPDPGPVAAPPGVAERERTTDRETWRTAVTGATERIHDGRLQKVVLAQALEATLEAPLSLPDALARLDDRYPDCFRFLLEPATPAGCEAPELPVPAFFGATPERLVSLRGRTVETGALAGTTGRGETPAEDEWLAAELLGSEKDNHEHDLVVETIRDQLAPYAASASTGGRTVRRLATVQHLWTPVTATLTHDEHVLSLVEALHPTPAVGGLPPGRALAAIRETEPFDRGWYAAPVGWIDAAGYGSFAVALRSAVVRGDSVTMFAGVGVVGDSDPDEEWNEVELKFRPILDELEG